MSKDNCIKCDYFIIGAGIAGLYLKYKLLGNTVLVDKNPFRYKVGESHNPILFFLDPGLFSLYPKFQQMESFSNKLGVVFCDSHKGKYATQLPSALGQFLSLHCERSELERLLADELQSDIRQEEVKDINFKEKLVVTDRNTYYVDKYILDCSGPAMVVANKLDLVKPFEQFADMKAQWGYWKITKKDDSPQSWAYATVLNRIGRDTWSWQIPLYNSSILSMGIVQPEDPMDKKKFIKFAESYAAPCYKLKSIHRHPELALKPYMTNIYSRQNYARISSLPSADNWILVGDALCFGDPIYSLGTGSAALQALTIAEHLNESGGEFNHSWYRENLDPMIDLITEGMNVWYSSTQIPVDQDIKDDISRLMLRGEFGKDFSQSMETMNAMQIKAEYEKSFRLKEKVFSNELPLKVYYFNPEAFKEGDDGLTLSLHGRKIQITKKKVAEVFKQRLRGKILTYHDLYLICELELREIPLRDYFWKIIKVIEHYCGSKVYDHKPLFCFYGQWYDRQNGTLILGDDDKNVSIDDKPTIGFYESLKGRFLSKEDLDKEYARHISRNRDDISFNLSMFYTKFGHIDDKQFGLTYCL